MQLVDAGTAQLAVREWGEPGGRAVVFWHALGDGASGEYFAPVAERLAAAGHRVVAVDGPGFGASPLLDAPAYALESLAGLLGGVVDQLQLAPFALIGHSWGGAVAVRYAGIRPETVAAVVLLDSGHIDYADLAEVDAGRSADDWVEQVRARGGERPEARGRAMHGMTERISDAWPVLAAHEIPVLLILGTLPPHGEQNRAHVGRFQEAVPHADVRWADNAGHGIVDDVGPALGDEIAAWLAE